MTHQWHRVDLLKKHGFDGRTAVLALGTIDLDTKEKVAASLRGELKKLRDSKKATLRRVEIADLAMTMLEQRARFEGVGKEQLCLFQELLDVDRHRKKVTPNEKLRWAAAHDGLAIQNGKILGVRELARRAGVSPRAIVDWRRSTIYHREIATGLGTQPEAVATLFASLSRKPS
jgi:hypothetical protein